jgi:hypothetical protein
LKSHISSLKELLLSIPSISCKLVGFDIIFQDCSFRLLEVVLPVPGEVFSVYSSYGLKSNLVFDFGQPVYKKMLLFPIRSDSNDLLQFGMQV